jgi:asparagine synthase (glutamine-hydrolysing)
MADSLRHRGPDDEGFFEGPNGAVGLAHRRLSIIDLEGGRQPISNEDGSITTVFNGAIYNYRELRAELIKSGHRFKTQTDTEVIVHLYEEHGVEFTTKIRGMFAIAIWDDLQRQLVVTRDRAGKKPLYYSESGDEFLFASQVCGIRAAATRSLDLDPQAVADYLTWCCVPAPGTIYQNVCAVEPAQTLIIRDRRIVSKTTYWRQPLQPKTHLPQREAVEQIDELLRESVRLRLRADVPVGAFLSGGIDSGLIVALATEALSRKLVTITIGFQDGAFDEREMARSVANRYDTDHHEILVRPDVAADLPLIAQAYDQPFADSSAVPSYYAARAARPFTKVILNGDGGDELFAGYRRYIAALFAGLFHWADGPMAQAGWRTLGNLMPAPRGFRTDYAFFHRWIRGMGLNPVERYMAWSVDALSKTELQNLLRSSNSVMKCGEIEQSDRLARATLAHLADCGPVDRMMGTDFATVLPNDFLVKMDIASMASGLEARSPFLDHELIEAVSGYPDRLKIRGRETKPLLRELARRYLPEAVIRAPKRGFEVPLTKWLRGDLQALTQDVLLARKGLLADLFERSALERLVNAQDRLEPARWSRRVWLLLMLGLWDGSVRK